MRLTKLMTFVAIEVLSLGPLVHGQDAFGPFQLNLLKSLSEAPPISYFPLTKNDTSVRIPDIDQTLALVFITPNLTGPLSPQAIDLLNQETPFNQRSKVLYDVDRILGYGPAESRFEPPLDPYNVFSNIATNFTMSPLLSLQWTTISGSSQWFWPGNFVAINNRCNCAQKTSTLPDSLMQSHPDEAFSQPDELKASLDKPMTGEGCSPKVLAHIKFNRNFAPAGSLSTLVFPTIQDIVQAQFDMVVEVLRNETAIPILESIQLRNQELFNYTIRNNEVGSRIMQVAGLPTSAVGNMRGFLTIRQYALYQLLRRGDSDCPIAPTDCGKNGPDRCDRYPPVGLARRTSRSGRFGDSKH